MSHIKTVTTDVTPNFLASAVGLTVNTCTVSADGVSADENGYKIVPAGTVYPSNDAKATGILFEDVDVTDGDHEGALIVAGRILKDCLPVEPATEAVTPLTASGIIFVTE